MKLRPAPIYMHDDLKPHRIPDGVILVQDTREQKGLWKPQPWIVEKGLKTGDYSVVGMEEMVTVERKSIIDLFGSLGKGRKRFDREIERMLKMKWAGLMIEGLEDKVMRRQYRSQMNVQSVYGSLCSMETDGIHIYFADSKRSAKDWILSRLIRFYEHYRLGKI